MKIELTLTDEDLRLIEVIRQHHGNPSSESICIIALRDELRAWASKICDKEIRDAVLKAQENK